MGFPLVPKWVTLNCKMAAILRYFTFGTSGANYGTVEWLKLDANCL